MQYTSSEATIVQLVRQLRVVQEIKSFSDIYQTRLTRRFSRLHHVYNRLFHLLQEHTNGKTENRP